MKKVIYSLFFVFAAVFTACEEELPKANFDLYELKSLEASAGDMNVTLTWEDYENAHPSEYLVIWTTGAAEDDGGQMTVGADKKSVVVENLVNDMTYGFSVQPRYAGGLAGKTSVSGLLPGGAPETRGPARFPGRQRPQNLGAGACVSPA